MNRILLVDDDNRIHATVLAFFLTRDDEVQAVSSGQAALSQLRSNRFDLIVTDLFMGNGDGIELIRRIRKIDPIVPIILITGGGANFPPGSQNLANLADIANVLGACHVLYKPFRRNSFLAIVDQILKGEPKETSVGSADPRHEISSKHGHP